MVENGAGRQARHGKHRKQSQMAARRRWDVGTSWTWTCGVARRFELATGRAPHARQGCGNMGCTPLPLDPSKCSGSPSRLVLHPTLATKRYQSWPSRARGRTVFACSTGPLRARVPWVPPDRGSVSKRHGCGWTEVCTVRGYWLNLHLCCHRPAMILYEQLWLLSIDGTCCTCFREWG
jgi:hypothetical protein